MKGCSPHRDVSVYTQRHMSFEKALREMIRVELATQLRPLQKSIAILEKGLGQLGHLRAMTAKLAPLAASQGVKLALASARGGGKAAGKAVTKAAPVKAAPVKAAPVKAETGKAPASPARSAGKGAAAAVAAAAPSGACAIAGCKRPSRSKGYCSAHYQKLRLLIRTNRRPADWVDNAAPQSAKDVKLPRGRAAAQERQAAEPRQEEPKDPPKPKAWVRKKGAPGLVSLH
jgi:hypothetical protein